MADSITININLRVDGVAEKRKNLAKALPAILKSSMDDAGADVEMESNEQIQAQLPEGWPGAFSVPEEVLVFPTKTADPDVLKEGRKRLTRLRSKLRRQRTAGNTEK